MLLLYIHWHIAADPSNYKKWYHQEWDISKLYKHHFFHIWRYLALVINIAFFHIGRSSSETLLVAANSTACDGTGSNIRTLEHVQVIITLHHRHRGHVSIELISPSSTRTRLLKTRRNDKSTKGLKVGHVGCFRSVKLLRTS